LNATVLLEKNDRKILWWSRSNKEPTKNHPTLSDSKTVKMGPKDFGHRTVARQQFKMKDRRTEKEAERAEAHSAD